MRYPFLHLPRWYNGKDRLSKNIVQCETINVFVDLIFISAGSGGGGSGGGIFLVCEDFGRMFDHSFPACSFFVVVLKWRFARAH